MSLLDSEPVDQFPSHDWPLSRILGVNLAMGGLQFAFATYCCLVVPVLNEMGFTSTESILIMLAGPICGFFVQPITGFFSDRSTSKLGRRRPFLLFGAIGTSISLIVLGYGYIIIPDSQQTLQQIVIVSGVVLIQLFINVMLSAFRALIADVVPQERQNAGATYSGFMMGLSFLICNAIIFVVLETGDSDTPNYQSILTIVAGISAVVVFLFLFPTLKMANETPLTPDQVPPPTPIFSGLWKETKNMDSDFVHICVVLFFGWCSYTPLQTFLSAVYPLDVALIGLITCNLATTLICPVLSKKLEVWGERNSFLICAAGNLIGCGLLQAGSVGSTYIPWLNNGWSVGISLALVGLINAAMNTIPFAILGKRAADNVKGTYAGIFNASIVIAQACANLVMIIVDILFNHNYSRYPILVATTFAVVVFFAGFMIPNMSDSEGDKKSETRGLLSDNTNEVL
eukprot:gnl/Dysnectes_brevis/1849_a2121_2067.p1 GENE.gnl/Dysnectes_brevis/1849_a2121_2067~~gnl/Dysnectes_brevis/1849_a2121_2067.p1  ORF type:complete len:457 (+),score=153.53 gnl/Dysnectes_brevis/1849_a2121_2067:47-1417(+)